MKAKIIFTYFCILVSLFSCDAHVRKVAFKQYSEIEGKWKLSSMEYTDENDVIHNITSSQTTISFNGNSNKNTVGKIVTLSKEFDFGYNFSLENCSIDVYNRDDLPIDAPGRSSIFVISFYKNRFEIFTDQEFLTSENKIFRNVKYSFERL